MSAFFRFNGHDFLILGKSKEKAMLIHFFNRAGFVLERGRETCKKKNAALTGLRQRRICYD